MNQNDYFQWSSLIISLIALVISLIALVYTILTFLLKSGHKLRCDISTCSTIECDDKYVSSITLENLKDRATVIFDIYLKIGYNNYLLIESFSQSPLILKPFEVYYKEYDPILLYDVGVKRISLNKLLDSFKIKRHIILSTTDGRYKVKTHTKHWRPEVLFFKNFTTAIIRPYRLYHKEKAYGSNVKFLLTLTYKDRDESIIPLHDGDEQLKIFKNFALTEESLTSKEMLEAYIQLQKEKGNLDFDNFEVIPFNEKVNEIHRSYEEKPVEAEAYGFFKYKIIGRLFTIFENKKINQENRKRQTVQKQQRK